MPSEAQVTRAWAALAGPVQRYRSAVAEALEQLHGWLARHRDGSPRVSEAAVELGRFAEGRLDAARYAMLSRGADVADSRGVAAVERAVEVLSELLAQGPQLGTVHVPAGGDIYACVTGALARVGRAFGASAVAQEAKRGMTVAPDDRRLSRFPYARWNSSERKVGLPVVVTVGGPDCRPGGLAEFLDGAQHIVLVVDGDCSPAPLARLITPGTYVAQVASLDELTGLTAVDGPAIAAVVPEWCARFVHDPSRTERLQIQYLPQELHPTHAGSGLSVRQQREELSLLLSLTGAGLPQVAVQGTPRAPAGSPVDTLAAWLLSQSGMSPTAG